MKTAVMTDTNSGITKRVADKFGIHLIHMPIVIDGKVFYEGENLTRKDFFDKLFSCNRISTSQPSIGDIINEWDNILNSGYDEIIYIPMSSGLSSACGIATGIAQDYKGKIQVIDNHRVSVTLKDSVFHAKSLVDMGFCAKEIKNILEKDALNSIIYIAVDNLDYLKKGGRITPVVAMIGTIFSIKPILKIQGEKLDLFSKTRGNIKKCGFKIIDAIKFDLENRFKDQDLNRLHIGIAGASLDECEKNDWLSILKGIFPFADIYYDSLPYSVICHTGPNALGMGVSFR